MARADRAGGRNDLNKLRSSASWGELRVSAQAARSRPRSRHVVCAVASSTPDVPPSDAGEPIPLMPETTIIDVLEDREAVPMCRPGRFYVDGLTVTVVAQRIEYLANAATLL
jgi:hypothetical protein